MKVLIDIPELTYIGIKYSKLHHMFRYDSPSRFVLLPDIVAEIIAEGEIVEGSISPEDLALFGITPGGELK